MRQAVLTWINRTSLFELLVGSGCVIFFAGAIYLGATQPNVMGSLAVQIGGLTAATAIVGWLLRSYLSQSQAKDLERFKAQLESEAEVQKHGLTLAASKEIERLKAELQIQHHEHVLRFGRIHEKQAEILAQAYAQAVSLRRLASEYVTHEAIDTRQSADKHLDNLRRAMDEFRDYILPREIYMVPQTWKMIEQYFDRLNEVLSKPFDRTNLSQFFGAAGGRFHNDLELVLAALRDDFRALLGTELTALSQTVDSPDHDAAHQPQPGS